MVSTLQINVAALVTEYHVCVLLFEKTMNNNREYATGISDAKTLRFLQSSAINKSNGCSIRRSNCYSLRWLHATAGGRESPKARNGKNKIKNKQLVVELFCKKNNLSYFNGRTTCRGKLNNQSVK